MQENKFPTAAEINARLAEIRSAKSAKSIGKKTATYTLAKQFPVGIEALLRNALSPLSPTEALETWVLETCASYAQKTENANKK